MTDATNKIDAESIVHISPEHSKIKDQLSFQQNVYHENTLIKGSLDQINKTVSTLPSGAEALSFQSALLGALVASLAAYLLNLFHWYTMRKFNNLSHSAVLAKEHVKEFEKSTSLYWSEEKNSYNQSSMIILETQIQATFEMQHVVLSQFSDNKLVKKTDKDIINAFLGQVFNIATGGDFKSFRRDADMKKVWKISKECTRVSATLMKYIKAS